MNTFALVIIISIALWAITYLLNETPFLYFTPKIYTLPDASKLDSPDCAAVDHLCPGSDEAIVFLTGYMAIPGQLKHLTEQFKDRYNLCVVLYPGCGTTLEDFQASRFTQWHAAARDKYIEYREKYKKVYLCGFSMGGDISYLLAAEFRDKPDLKPDAVITMSTPVFFNNLFGAGVLYSPTMYVVRYASWLTKSLAKGPDLDIDLVPSVKECDKVYSLKAIYSMKMGAYLAKKALKKVDVPLLLFHATGDRHSPYQNMSYIAKHVSSRTIRTKTFDMAGKEYDRYTRHFIPFYQETCNEIAKEIKDFLQAI